MTANGDGSYTLSKYGTYRYSVTAEGYKDVKNVFMHQPDQMKDYGCRKHGQRCNG